MGLHRLILMRHAKSSWDDASLRDHDRPLSKRGYRSCQLIGKTLRGAAILPEEAFISSALRCLETWQGLKSAAHLSIPHRVEPDLYHAGTARMFEILRSSRKPVVLMLGHNPGTAVFASLILKESNLLETHAQFGRFPTAATAVIEFDIGSWSDLVPATGELIEFWIPRELEV